MSGDRKRKLVLEVSIPDSMPDGRAEELRSLLAEIAIGLEARVEGVGDGDGMAEMDGHGMAEMDEACVVAMMVTRWPDLWPTEADATAALWADYPPGGRYLVGTTWNGGCEHLVLRPVLV